MDVSIFDFIVKFLLPCDAVFYLCLVQDVDGSVPFFWGTDAEGHLILADDMETVKKGCGKSFAPFPKGKTIREYPNLLSISKSFDKLRLP